MFLVIFENYFQNMGAPGGKHTQEKYCSQGLCLFLESIYIRNGSIKLIYDHESEISR